LELHESVLDDASLALNIIGQIEEQEGFLSKDQKNLRSLLTVMKEKAEQSWKQVPRFGELHGKCPFDNTFKLSKIN
jgi:DNA-directed RNA polymerase specialized sigma54-like protein